MAFTITRAARRRSPAQVSDALAPEPIPDLDLARSVLEDFTTFWNTETEPDTKRHFLSLIFEGVWLDERRVVAVQPKPSFLPFFESRQTADDTQAMGRKERERRGKGPVFAHRGIEIRV